MIIANKQDYTNNLMNEFLGFGLIVDSPILDGTIQRCFTGTTKQSGKKNGWYVGWSKYINGNDYICCVMGDWAVSEKPLFTYKSWQDDNQLSQIDREAIAKHQAELQQKTAEEKAKKHAETAVKAQFEWQGLSATGNSLYLENKGVQAHGIGFGMDKQDGGYIAIPLRDFQGNIKSLQRIYDKKPSWLDDSKYFLGGGEKKGLFHLIGEVSPDLPICFAEGYSTNASIHEATGYPCIIAFDAGNLYPVIESWRKHYPDYEFIICADNDQWKKENTGINKATAAAKAFNCRMVYPDFSGLNTDSKPTDFNDLHKLAGLDAVKKVILPNTKPVTNNIITGNFGQSSGMTNIADLPPEEQAKWADDDEEEEKPVFKNNELPIKHIGAICDFINSSADAYNPNATKHGALIFIAHVVGRTAFSSTGDKCNLMIGNISSKGDLNYINNGLELLFDSINIELHKTVRANRITHPQLIDFYHDKNSPRKLTFMPFSLGGDIKSSLRQTSNALSDIYAEIQQLHTKPVHTVYNAKNEHAKVFKPLLNCYANFTENDLFFFGKCSNAGGLFPLFINNLADSEFIINRLKRDPDTGKQSFIDLQAHVASLTGKNAVVTPSGRSFNAEPVANVIHWEVEPCEWQEELKKAIGGQHQNLFSAINSQFIRLSVIIAAWNGEQIVSEQLADYCCHYLCARVQAVLEALSKRSSDDVAPDVMTRVLSIIYNGGKDGVTDGYIAKCFSGYRKLSTMEKNDLINSLEKQKLITKKESGGGGNGSKGGKKGYRYFIV